MEPELKLIKDGASANGLRLIGDRTIGYRFVPRSDFASFADNMLTIAAEQTGANLSAWCEANKDGDYSMVEWNANHCMCDACKCGIIHSSDCAVHNEPAMKNGACDCRVSNVELTGAARHERE